MRETDDLLLPFLRAVSRQLRGAGPAGPSPSVSELRRLVSAAAAGRSSELLAHPAVLSSFFANLDLLPMSGGPRVDAVLHLVREASENAPPT